MPEPTGTSNVAREQGTWRRRGLLAAWAAVAATVMRRTEQPVSASTAALIANTETAGISNSVVGPSTIAATGAYTSPSAILIADASNSVNGALAALHGAAFLPVAAPRYCGVYGQGGIFTGVLGTSSSTAVYGISGGGSGGDSTSGIGVMGQIPAASTNHAVGVYAVNSSSFAGSAPGAGGFGLYGVSFKGPGVFGAAGTAGATGVAGWDAGIAGAYAGVFFGSVVVEGNFTVLGGAKSAAVPHPDGTHRRLYCVESPESWFEDFGKGQLNCGQAEVMLDPDFAAVVDLDDYQVFLTQYGGYEVLSVTEQTSRGFRVETRDATSTSRFGWRVVAKRKDIASPRFETVERSAKPQIPNIPELPAPDPPRQPEVRQHRH